jgi:hypothetical protein
MKKLAALLVAVALLSPAFAQKLTFQGTHPRPKAATVAPASKPVLLYTGKPITPDQKRQLMETVTKGSAPRTPAGAAKVQNLVLSTANVITPDQLFLNGVYVDAFGARVDQFDGILSFQPGAQSYLTFNVTVKPNTAYTLLMKVRIDGVTLLPNAPGPLINILSGSELDFAQQHATQIFPPDQAENEFAYGVVSNRAGNLPVTIYSPNSYWSFLSCEITSAAF